MNKKSYSANFPLKRFRDFFVNACRTDIYSGPGNNLRQGEVARKVLEINPEPFPTLFFLVFLIIEPV